MPNEPDKVYLETVALLVRVIIGQQQNQLTKQDLNRAVRQIITALGDKVDPAVLASLANELKDSAGSLESAIAATKK